MINVIYVFGPSCSGKSTLGKALQKSLGNRWTYLDRDELIEQGICTEHRANAVLDQKISLLKSRVIIDAQIPWRERRSGERYFLVLPPLKVLLERDEYRTIRLHRPKERAMAAKKYVIETHEILSKMDKKDFDEFFDSSQFSVLEEIRRIESYIFTSEATSHYYKILCLGIGGMLLALVCVLFRQKNNQ